MFDIEDIKAFIIKALQAPVECSLEDLRQFSEFSSLGLLDAIEKIDETLKEASLTIQPAVTAGELDQKRVVKRAQPVEEYKLAFETAISTQEGQKIEYKESLYVKKKLIGKKGIAKENLVSEEIIFECIKTICAFLNADGGTLLIGVSDGGEIEGIDCELNFVKGGDGSVDKWELFLNNCLEKYIFDFSSCIGYISKNILRVEEKYICIVLVQAKKSSLTVCRSPSNANAEIVYVRNGNSSKEIKVRAIEELIKTRMGLSSH